MRIRDKLIVQSIFLLGMALASADLFFYFAEKKHLLAEQEKAQKSSVTKLARVCGESLLGKNDIFLLNYARTMMENFPEIVWIAALDPSGTYLFHSDLLSGDARLLGKKASGWWAREALIKSGSPISSGSDVAVRAGGKSGVLPGAVLDAIKTPDIDSPRILLAPILSQGEVLGIAVLAYNRGVLNDNLKTTLSRSHKRFIWIILAALFLGILGSTVMAAYFNRPIIKLMEGARAIGKGDWDFRIDLANQNDELGMLAMEFNEMTRKLRDLDELKDSFLHHVSHEIRNPLGAIGGYLQMMSKQSGDLTETHRGYVEIIRKNVFRLNGLVDDVLLLAALEAGQIRYDIRPCELKGVAQSVVELFAASAKEKNILLDCDIPRDTPMVMMDSERIRQVLINLVANALKYTPEGGGVRIGAQEWNNLSHVRVFVMDTGSGIPAEKIKMMFSKFSRVDDESSKRMKGTGLGLYICRQIINAHNGSIWVESGAGQGSIFSFTLKVRDVVS